MSAWPDPYGTQRNPNPYPQADQAEAASGYVGSTTPASVANATTPARGAANVNPFTAVLDHVATINNAFGGSYGSPMPFSAAPQSTPGNFGSTSPAVPGAYGPPTSGGMGPGSGATPVPSTPVFDPVSGLWAWSQSAGGVDHGTGPGDGSEQRLPDGGGDGGGAAPPPPATTPPPPPGSMPPPGSVRGRPADPVTSHNDWLHSDSTGKPWGHDNLPPKPAGTEDPSVAARWYQQFNFLDPSLVNVSAADVQAFRTSGYNPTEEELSSQPGMLRSAFLAWWQHGKPTPAQTPPPTTLPGGPTNPNGWVDPAAGAPPQQHRYPPPGATPDGGGAAAPPPGASPGTTVPAGSTTPPAVTAPPPAAPPPTSSMEEITKLIDLFNSGKGPQQPPIEDMLNPMFARQRQLLADQMRAEAAATGAIHSGGFGENLGSALSNLSGQQSAALAGEMGQDYLAKLSQNTQLTTLATQAGMQKYMTDVNADLDRYKVQTNDDLQRWLTDKNNTLAKYGIDTNDVLQRYLGKLGIDKANIDAKATVDAAALHAAAAEAAAAASSAAAQYSANVQLQLGQGNLQVQREDNMGKFILGLLGLGQQGLGNLGDIFGNFPPGSFVVKP